MDNNELLKNLEYLLENEIITQEEFELKKAQLEEAEKASAVDSDPTNDLDELLALKIISEDEYNSLKSSVKEEDPQPISDELSGNRVITVPQDNTTTDTNKNSGIGSYLKRNWLVCLIATVLLVALGLVSSRLVSTQNEINELSEKLTKTEQDLSTARKNYNETYSELSDYRIIGEFYLDNAAICIEGSDYCHRYGCPKLPDEFSYVLYNDKTAKNYGFTKCATCFSSDYSSYMKNVFDY